jgi:hypothetical protein
MKEVAEMDDHRFKIVFEHLEKAISEEEKDNEYAPQVRISWQESNEIWELSRLAELTSRPEPRIFTTT